MGGGGGQADIDGRSEQINSLVPIFVLKYIDDAGDESDFYTVVGYATDLALLFAGGYSLVTKLKYLRTLSGFTELVVLGEEYSATKLFTLYATTGVEALDLTASAISFLLKLSSKYKDKPWYKNLNETISWIEFLIAAGGVISDTLLKVSAKNLVEDFNSLEENWPEDFTEDVRGAEAVNLLQNLSGVSANVSCSLLEASQQRIEKISAELFAKDKKKAFSLFGQNGEALHTEEELAAIIKIAFDAGVSDREIAELIHISYRKAKLIETSQLLLQVKYYSRVTRVKKYPAGFSSLNKFVGFCNEIQNFWRNYYKYLDDLYGLNLSSVKYELKIQGSVVRKKLEDDPLPEDINASDYVGLQMPGDIEYAIIMDAFNFNSYLDQFTIMAKLQNDAVQKALLLNQINAGRSRGNLSKKFFKILKTKNNETILREIRFLTNNYTNFKEYKKELNFAVITTGNYLDLGPYLPFKF